MMLLLALAMSLSGELQIALVDTTELPNEARATLMQEVERIYRPAGVTIAWSKEPNVSSKANVATVFVMNELPASLAIRKRTFGHGDAMGVALGRLGKTSGPVIYVSRRAIKKVIVDDADTLGVALGRVVAHELGHRFLQRKHTRRGLMKSGLAAHDLEGPGNHLTLNRDEARRLASRAKKE